MSAVTARSDCVGENEERCVRAARSVEPFDQQTVLVVQHLLQTLATDVPLAGAVNGVAYRLVVGRNRFGDCARRAAHAKEPARHLLPRADLGERAMLRRIEIDLKRFLARFSRFVVIHRFPLALDFVIRESFRLPHASGHAGTLCANHHYVLGRPPVSSLACSHNLGLAELGAYPARRPFLESSRFLSEGWRGSNHG